MNREIEQACDIMRRRIRGRSLENEDEIRRYWEEEVRLQYAGIEDEGIDALIGNIVRLVEENPAGMTSQDWRLELWTVGVLESMRTGNSLGS